MPEILRDILACQFDLWDTTILPRYELSSEQSVDDITMKKNTALKFNQIHILQWSTRPSTINNLSHQQWWKNPTISHSSLTTRQCVGCVGFATFCRSWLGGSTGLWTAWAQLHLQCGWPSLSRADATARRKQIRQMWQAMTCGSAKFVLCQQGRGNSFELWLIPYQWDTWFCWITGVGSMSRWIPGGWSTSINTSSTAQGGGGSFKNRKTYRRDWLLWVTDVKAKTLTNWLTS